MTLGIAGDRQLVGAQTGLPRRVGAVAFDQLPRRMVDGNFFWHRLTTDSISFRPGGWEGDRTVIEFMSVNVRRIEYGQP